MRWRYSTGVLAGTHSAIYSCMILHLSSQPRLRIPSATEKHTKKQPGFRAFSNSGPNLWNALPQILKCPSTNSQGSRFLCNVPQTSKNSPVFWLTCPVQCLLYSLCMETFLCLPKTFSVHFLSMISFSVLNIQVSGTMHYKNGHHHHLRPSAQSHCGIETDRGREGYVFETTCFLKLEFNQIQLTEGYLINLTLMRQAWSLICSRVVIL